MKFELDANGDVISRSYRTGGNLGKNKKRFTRLFDVPGYKRRVTVTICQYILGTHHWVTIKEEDNPVYNTTKDDFSGETKVIGWQKAWDDPQADGRRFEEKFPLNQSKLMETWIKLTLKEEFDDKGIEYRLERETLGSSNYGRSGD